MNEKKGRNLKDVMKDVCSTFGNEVYTSYQVYFRMMELPKKNGSKRHYSLTYSEVKQSLARADYVMKVPDEDGKSRITKYKNKEGYFVQENQM